MLRKDALDFVQKLPVQASKDILAIAPSFTLIDVVKNARKNFNFRVGAQNVASHTSGAFTGEVSALMLKDSGVDFVIIGHSERRHIYNESDAVIHEKVIQTIEAGLDIILCVGETLKQREQGDTNRIIKEQISSAFRNVQMNQKPNLMVAYEPVWAIGTGVTPTVDQIDDAHKFIQECFDELNMSVPVLYGGSVSPKNYEKIIQINSVGGFLIGGASLDVKSFIQITGEKNILL